MLSNASFSFKISHSGLWVRHYYFSNFTKEEVDSFKDSDCQSHTCKWQSLHLNHWPLVFKVLPQSSSIQCYPRWWGERVCGVWRKFFLQSVSVPLCINKEISKMKATTKHMNRSGVSLLAMHHSSYLQIGFPTPAQWHGKPSLRTLAACGIWRESHALASLLQCTSLIRSVH